MNTVVVSGGFDPLHAGHLALFRYARSLGDRLVVIVEPDEFVARKHKVLLPQTDRAAVVGEMREVSWVMFNRVAADCSGALSAVAASERPAGSDRTLVYVVGPDHADMGFPEAKTCRRLGIAVKVRPPMPEIDGRSSSRLIAGVQWDNPVPMVAAVVSFRGRAMLARRAGTDLWELPGGFVERGETLEQAVRREVREECRLDLWDPDWLGSFVGRYRDGRGTVVGAFCASTGQTPEATMECDGFEYVGEPPPVDRFHDEVDYRILSAWFERRKT